MITKVGNRVVKSRSYPDKVVAVGVSKVYNALNVLQTTYGNYPSLVVSTKAENITYTTKRVSERHLPNVCDHSLFERYYVGDPSIPFKVRAPDPHCTDGWYHLYNGTHTIGPHGVAETTALAALGVGNLTLPYPGVPLDDMNAKFDSLRPDLTALSLPNFFLELDDIQKLWLHFKDSLAFAQKLAKGYGDFTSTAKQLAGTKLSLDFGIKPLIGDLSSMKGLLHNLLAKLHAFDALAGKHFNQVGTINKSDTTVAGTFNYLGNSLVPVTWSATYSVDKKAGVVFRALPRAVTGGYEEILRTILDALGFELNPRILWDAIPFTFVLDWFFDIGSWLERHKHDTLELPVKYLGSYVQVKQDLMITSSFIQNPSNLCSDTGKRVSPSWVTHKKRFMRIPVAPTESIFRGLGWHLPTLNQAQLLFDLGAVLGL
jgi:hypothetical protein